MLTPRRVPGVIVTNELFLTLLALVLFGLLLWKGSKEVRGLAAFLIFYGLWRVLEVAIFGNGFNDFVRDMFQRISVAFGNLSNPDGLAFATLAITVLIILGLLWLMVAGKKGLRALAAFLIIMIVVRIFDAVALNNGFGSFAAGVIRGLSNIFGQGAANIP